MREEEDEDGRRVKVITSAISLVPSEKLDQDTARAIAAVARGATGGLGIKIIEVLPPVPTRRARHHLFCAPRSRQCGQLDAEP